MLISCVLQCTDGLRLIKRLENYAYRMSEKTAYRSLEKSAYRSLKKLLTVHLQIHLTACKYLKTIPGDFKEEYVKYNSNPGDSTIINFNIQSLHDLYQTIKLSNEFLMEYYYDGDEAPLLKTGELDRLLNMAKTEDEKELIINKYGVMEKYKL